MLFNSLEYILLFLPLTAIVYFSLNRYDWPTVAKVWLVVASLVFYCRLLPIFGLLLLASILFNFMMGRAIYRNPAYGRALLIVAIGSNLGVLGYFKYANFLVESFSALMGLDVSIAKIILPLGISFFTFTQMAYLVDVYRRIAHEYSIIHYFLFVTYFPHLVAGPILHHKEMMPQFADAKNNAVNWENIFAGLFIFSIGLFKKVIVADQFALWANAGYGSERDLLFHEAWITSLSYTLQIYFDFSGYTDMAIGASLMFNIVLPLNFNSPYKALNIQDFWSRWHMTLSRWLRDYVYIPLGGNRHGKGRTYLNLVLTFLLGGLWHGANWTFVVWGALHGAASMMHKAWQSRGLKMPVLLAWFVTFMFVNVTWVFFAADNFADAARVLSGMVGLNGFADAALLSGEGLSGNGLWAEVFLNSMAGNRREISIFIEGLGNTSGAYFVALPWLLFWLAAALCLPNSMELATRYLKHPVLPMLWISAALALPLFVLIFMSSRITEFIYFNF